VSQEIHITVPKGAQVIIHEEDEPEVERSLEERIDDLLKLLESQPQKEYIFIPYPTMPAPQIVPMPYPVYPQPSRTVPNLPRWYVGDLPYPPYTVTCTTSNDTAYLDLTQ
jgi:hypothetical protein